MNLHLLGDIILPYEVNNNLQYSILSRMSEFMETGLVYCSLN